MAVIVHRDGRLVVGGTAKDFRLSDVNQSPTVRYGGSSLTLTGFEASYSYIYRKQLWVYTVVNKLSYGTARLPLPVYERADRGRPKVNNHPYSQLLQRPNERMDPVFLWLWTASTFFVYGNAFWRKMRDRGDVKELWPIHPANMTVERDGSRTRYYFGTKREEIPAEDLVHFRTYNPDSLSIGLSPLEPLRQTLLNEDASRRATSAFWLNGARPGFALKHPKQLSKDAASRLRSSFDEVHSGADQTAKTVVLEEGMEAQVLQLSAEEAQYIETRKLNREEVCGGFDVPPPVVHILDRATYSNITEQMRSMYRDTMAPKLRIFEATLETQLRPEFGDGVYAEFLMDEVLRGAFEARAEAYQKMVNTGGMTPAEVREKENLPFIEGSDQLFMNAASVPIGMAGVRPTASDETVRAVMGRIGRITALEQIDRDALVMGLNGDSETVLRQLDTAKDIDDFRTKISALGGSA